MKLHRRNWFLLPSLALLLSACGGGGGSAPARSTPSVTVDWPVRTRDLSGPSSALSVKIILQPASGANVQIVGDRASTLTANSQTYSATSAVPVGAYNLTATFYSQAAEGGVVTATATVPVNVTTTGALTAQDGSALGAIAFTTLVKTVAVAKLSVSVGGTGQLLVTASDATGNVLALTPGSYTFTETSGAADATITPDGIVTGVAGGSATVTASVDGVTSAPATVTVVLAPDFADPSFESPVVASNYIFEPTGIAWTGPAVQNWGIATGTGSWGTGAHSGNQYLFIQGDHAVSQVVSGLVSGHKYQVTFWSMQREGDVGGNSPCPLSLVANGTTIVPQFLPGTSWVQTTSQTFTATTDSYTFTLQGQDPGYDASDLIDDVHLVDVTDLP